MMKTHSIMHDFNENLIMGKKTYFKEQLWRNSTLLGCEEVMRKLVPSASFASWKQSTSFKDRRNIYIENQIATK